MNFYATQISTLEKNLKENKEEKKEDVPVNYYTLNINNTIEKLKSQNK